MFETVTGGVAAPSRGMAGGDPWENTPLVVSTADLLQVQLRAVEVTTGRTLQHVPAVEVNYALERQELLEPLPLATEIVDGAFALRETAAYGARHHEPDAYTHLARLAAPGMPAAFWMSWVWGHEINGAWNRQASVPAYSFAANEDFQTGNFSLRVAAAQQEDGRCVVELVGVSNGRINPARQPVTWTLILVEGESWPTSIQVQPNGWQPTQWNRVMMDSGTATWPPSVRGDLPAIALRESGFPAGLHDWPFALGLRDAIEFVSDHPSSEWFVSHPEAQLMRVEVGPYGNRASWQLEWSDEAASKNWIVMPQSGLQGQLVEGYQVLDQMEDRPLGNMQSGSTWTFEELMGRAERRIGAPPEYVACQLDEDVCEFGLYAETGRHAPGDRAGRSGLVEPGLVVGLAEQRGLFEQWRSSGNTL
ncbi:MAG: hypothetical protein ACPHID_07050 [Thermoplasmatota archaeon]